MEEIIQGSPEWLQLRCGVITASHASDILMKPDSAGYQNYLWKLALERLTGCIVDDGFKNAYMERGNADEEAARDCYSFITGNEIEQVAFVKHHKFDFAGMSPDGLCGTEGMIEVKRKIPAHHGRYLLKNEVPAEYRKQMTLQLACKPSLKWNDFISYCPEMPEHLQLFICRLHRDESAIAEMEKSVIAFNTSVDEVLAKLKELKR